MAGFYMIRDIELKSVDKEVESCRPETCNFIKKETLAQVFSCKFCEISKNTFLHITPLVAASEYIDSG